MKKNKKSIFILGASGSVGKALINEILKRKDYEIKGIALNSNIFDPLILKLIKKCKSLEYVYINSLDAYSKFKDHKLSKKVTLRFQSHTYNVTSFIEEFKDEFEYSVNCLSGVNGIKPTLKLIDLNKKIFLANKESIVACGEIIKQKLKDKDERLIYPLDSEHSALFKLLKNVDKDDVEYICLTCSGGPFLNKDKESFKLIKVEEALKHPNFSMGKKITIDSSTLMNKAFEIVEAYYLFDYPLEKIKVAIDETSRCHSFIKLKDGRYKLSIGEVSMKTPINNCLDLYLLPKDQLEFKDTVIATDISKYNFKKVDTDKFPLILKGYEILKHKGILGLIDVIADDVATSLFLNNKINYLDIQKVIDKVEYEFSDNKNTLIKSSLMLKEEDLDKLMEIITKKAEFIALHLEEY